MSKAREIANQEANTLDNFQPSQTPAPNKIPVADSNGKLNDWVDAIGTGDMSKSTYDTNDNGIVDKAESIDDGNNNTASAIDIVSAVNLKHQQNTDTGTTATEFYVDTTGDNVPVKTHIQNTNNPHNVTAAQIGAITKVEDDTTPKLGGELDAQNHSIGFTEQAITSSSGSATIDWTQGNKAVITLTEDVTLTFTNPSKPCNLLLRIVQDSTGGHTLTFPTIKWAGGNAPTLTTTASAIDIISLYFDGTNYYGVATLNFA